MPNIMAPLEKALRGPKNLGNVIENPPSPNLDSNLWILEFTTRLGSLTVHSVFIFLVRITEHQVKYRVLSHPASIVQAIRKRFPQGIW